MSKDEILVIVAAVGVFIIINIIMWSIIAIANKISRRKSEKNVGSQPVYSQNLSTVKTASQHSVKPLEAEQKPQRCSRFEITDNLVITHTDESI